MTAIPEIPGPLDKAKRLHVSGIINDAKKLYLKLIELDSNNFLFQNLLGTTFLQLKKQV